MSLEDKVGQMLMAGFDGYTAPDYLLEWLRLGRLGGVILFARNVESPAQLANLCQELHSVAKYPLLVAIDQEGGTVARLREGFSESPGALALASIKDDAAKVTEKVSGVLATEMQALGINWTYAPVVDVTYNSDNPTVGTRSFGRDPERIATHAVAAMRGFQSAGVAACAKHFPGLGDTAIDTHLALPSLSTSLEQLQTVDLIPYRALIAEGLATIMTTHTIFTALDPEQPATHSRIIVQQLIREQLGFDGVVTTDCMEMKAIDDNYTVAESVVLAANAGIDVILFSHTPQKQAAAYEHLLGAAKAGTVPFDTIDAANARIAALKARFPAIETPNLTMIHTEAHQEIMLGAARDSITIIRNTESKWLHLDHSERVLLIEFSPTVDSLVQESTNTAQLSYFVSERLPFVETIILPAHPSKTEIDRVMQASGEVVVIATRNAHLIRPQAMAVQQICERFEKVILVALRNPYDADLVGHIPVLGSAGDSRPSLQAVAAVLAGDFVPNGAVGDAIWH